MFYNHNSDVNHLPMNPILYLQNKICIHVPVNTRYTHDKDKRAIQGAPLIKVRRSLAHLTFIMGPINNKRRPSRPYHGFKYNWIDNTSRDFNKSIY